MLRKDAWGQTRPRIAALLPAHRLARLAEYYPNAQRFNVLMDEHIPLKDFSTGCCLLGNRQLSGAARVEKGVPKGPHFFLDGS